MKTTETSVKTLSFNARLYGLTKGAIRLQEIDETGGDLVQRDDDCVAGTLYLRKLGCELMDVSPSDFQSATNINVTITVSK